MTRWQAASGGPASGRQVGAPTSTKARCPPPMTQCSTGRASRWPSRQPPGPTEAASTCLLYTSPSPRD
eukprot:8005759-Alexandrium_andersonii.AAC.1